VRQKKGGTFAGGLGVGTEKEYLWMGWTKDEGKVGGGEKVICKSGREGKGEKARIHWESCVWGRCNGAS